MRTFLPILAMLVLLLPQAALAGDAENPDLPDPCGLNAPTSTNYVEPEVDICGGWLHADVTGDDTVLDFTVQTLEPSVEGQRVIVFEFVVDECFWEVTFDDGMASPERIEIPVGEGGAVFPYFWDVSLRVACDRSSEPCYDLPEGTPCTTFEYERDHRADLTDLGLISVDGDEVTLTLDMAALDLDGTEVAGEDLVPGSVLTELQVQTKKTLTSLNTTGSIVCSTDCFGTRDFDFARGDRYMIPLPEDEG